MSPKRPSRWLAAAALAAAAGRSAAQQEQCPPCSSEPDPAPLQYANSLNGIKWPKMCVDNSAGDRNHFFTIGDWGGMLVPGRSPYPPLTFNHTSGKRPYYLGVDSLAQVNVAAVLNRVAATQDPQYVINLGDSFYPAGYLSTCGLKDMCSHAHTLQFGNVFENVYHGPGIDGKPWMGVLGNHDYGGWKYSAGWDQIIAYTWHSERWIMPAQYWSRRIQYCDFNVDYFFYDSNYCDAQDPSVKAHNICDQSHNTVDCSAMHGPKDVNDCVQWFAKMKSEQLQWLDKALAASDADWLIVVTHFNMEYVFQELLPLGKKYGVDLFITAHRHQQEIHYKDNVLPMGNIPWIISGGGGGITSEGNPEYDGHVLTQYGFFDIEIQKDKLIIDLWSHTGNKLSSTTTVPVAPGDPGAEEMKSLGTQGGSCANYGCVGFTKGHACQCNPDCGKHNSCCSDYKPQCVMRGRPAQAAASRRRFDPSRRLADTVAKPAEPEEGLEELGRRLQQQGGSLDPPAGCSADRRRRRYMGPAAIQNYLSNCWTPCGSKSGMCEYCGRGNACCRYGATHDPPECAGAQFPVLTYHTCVHPGPAAYTMAGLDSTGLVSVDEGLAAVGGDGELGVQLGVSPVIQAEVGEDQVVPNIYPESLFKDGQFVADMKVDLGSVDCFQNCGNKSGMCNYFCGAGRACCMKNNASDAEECTHTNVYGYWTEHHECVMVMDHKVTGEKAWGLVGPEQGDNKEGHPPEFGPEEGTPNVYGSPGLGVMVVKQETPVTPISFIFVGAGCAIVLAIVGYATGCGVCSGGQDEKKKPRKKARGVKVAEEAQPLTEAAAPAPVAAVPQAAAAMPAAYAPQPQPVRPTAMTVAPTYQYAQPMAQPVMYQQPQVVYRQQ